MLDTKSEKLEQRLDTIRKQVSRSGASLAPALPLVFHLRGQPYSLNWSHFMFEPMFRLVEMPRRMMLLCGRQVSKCLVVGGRGNIYLRNGRPVSGEQLQVGDEVLSFNDETLQVSTGRVRQLFQLPKKPCLRIRTRMGTVIDTATTHPIRTPLGYTRSEDLHVGSRIAAIRQSGSFGEDFPISDRRIIATASMVGDECCDLPGITSANNTHEVRDWLTEDGLWGRGSWEKFLPAWAFDLSLRQTRKFIECLWATDGVVKPSLQGRAKINYCTCSQRLAYELKALLLKFGIITSVVQRQTSHRDAWTVRVEGRDAQLRFLSLFEIPGKPGHDITFSGRENSNRDTLPKEFNQLVRQLCDQATYLRDGNSLRQAGLRRKPRYPLSRNKVEEYLAWLNKQGIEATELQRLQNSAVVWDEVVSIETIQDAPCWDMEVEGDHNYVIDGVVSHNSTSLAASQIIRAAIQPNYNILTVMPLFEQVRKFSQNYVRPFITTSLIRHRLVSELGTDSVLQRQVGPLQHNSSLFYSYSSGDPNRVRGIPADEIDCDEIQDLDHEDLPIIESCMGASPYKIIRMTGTPKTFDNTAHLLWEDSSQAHWTIPCICGKENKAAVDGNLLQMIGDGSKRPDGSVRTLICAFCGRDINSRAGYYVHDFPHRRAVFPGYHAPQPILPMHYESPKDWAVILETMNEKPTYVFYNEVLGESYDAGSKIITQEELVKTCQVTPAEPKNMKPSRYIATSLGIDWGGRGKEKTSDTDDFISNTAMAIGGMRTDGVIEIPWLHKVPYAVDMSHEAHMAVNVAAASRSDFMAMDYGGQGNVQEQQIRTWGWPVERVIPFTYSVMAPTRPIVFYNPPKHRGVRSSYTLDKPRSILLLAELLKRQLVLLPNSDRYIRDHLRDFFNIYEESIENPAGSPRRLVKRMSRRTDDVVHAVNFVVMSLYHYTQTWPKISEVFIEQEIQTARR